jgi:hypothetical protein
VYNLDLLLGDDDINGVVSSLEASLWKSVPCQSVVVAGVVAREVEI